MIPNKSCHTTPGAAPPPRMHSAFSENNMEAAFLALILFALFFGFFYLIWKNTSSSNEKIDEMEDGTWKVILQINSKVGRVVGITLMSLVFLVITIWILSYLLGV